MLNIRILCLAELSVHLYTDTGIINSCMAPNLTVQVQPTTTSFDTLDRKRDVFTKTNVDYELILYKIAPKLDVGSAVPGAHEAITLNSVLCS
jgi:hypothetical protein